MAGRAGPGLTTSWPSPPPVLMYHSVSPDEGPDPHLLRVSPQRLRSHLTLLRRLRLRAVPLGELVAAHRAGRSAGLVGLTFDDGYADFVGHAMPALADHGVRASIYVVADRLGGHNDWDDGPRLPMMTAEDVRTAEAAGHEVGSHTCTHPAMGGLSEGTALAEAVDSKARLEELLGHAVPGFCYPYGSHSAASAVAVREAGYDYACVVKDWTAPSRWTIPRFYVGQSDTPARLAAKLAVHRARRLRHAGDAR